MRDIQLEEDTRNIAIQKVGVKNLEYPITVLDRANGIQHTSAHVSLFADLPHNFKGTHMSRFIEIFNNHRKDLSMPKFLSMLDEIRKKLDAETAYGEVSFPYFVEKAAPVSLMKGMMSYHCAYSGRVEADKREFYVKVEAPIQTVCPCSKAISEYGAHNQRGVVTVTVKLGPFFWIEELLEIIEASGSSAVYSMLKREDEKFVTEQAYENPRFVEDVVREAYSALYALNKFPWFKVEAENFESIHNHSAYACAESDTSPHFVPFQKS